MIWLLLLACKPQAESSQPMAETPPVAPVALAGEDREVAVGDSLTFDVGSSEGAEFLWDFGDGSSATGEVVSHVYDEPGRFVAVLQATGTDGSWVSDSALITAYRPPTEVVASWSSTIATDGHTVWLVIPELDGLVRVDAGGSGRDALDLCSTPRTLAVDGAVVAVTCEGSDQLALVDGDSVELVDLGIGTRPYGVAGRDGTFFVSLQGTGQVAEVVGGSVVATHDVGPDPRGVSLTHDDRVLVTRFRSEEAEIYELGTTSVVLAADTAGDSDTTTGGVPNLLEQVVPSPDGTTWYVPALHANILRGSWVSGEELSPDTSLRAVLARVDAVTGTEPAATRKQFDERGRASAVVPSPLGELLYVLHPGTGTVSFLDAETGDQAGSILDAGTFPTGLALSPDGATLFVNAWLDRELRAFDLSLAASGDALAWSLEMVDEEPLSADVLAGKRVFHDARDPRMTRSGYTSCAHCHPDGRDDGLTWDFTQRGEGLRNTTSLEGRAGTAMGPLHWTANFDEVQDFEHDIRGPFGGSGFLSEEDWAECAEPLAEEKAGRSEELDALAAYLTSLDTTPPSPHGAPEGGAEVFAAAGCADCHTAPLYTDSSLDDPVRHDVGTSTEASGQRMGGNLDGLDTPTLLGTWATGPWLHDGSAETLRAAIEAHESASELSDDDLDLLAGFVSAL